MRLTRFVTTALALVVGAALPSTARAQRGIDIPDNATVQCNDGSWSMAANQRGACSSHRGVKRWIGSRPSNAAARCNDGAWWTNATTQGACSSHGGVYKSYKAEMKADKHEMKAEKKEMKADRKEMKAERKEERKEARP